MERVKDKKSPSFFSSFSKKVLPTHSAARSPPPLSVRISSAYERESIRTQRAPIDFPERCIPVQVAEATSPSSKGRTSQIRKLWEEAIEELPIEDKESLQIVPGRTDRIETHLDHVFESVWAMQKLCDEKRWKFEFRGHVIKLRDAGEKIICWLDKFKQVGDVAVNAAPIHAGLPWACVRFLLQAAVLESQLMASSLLGIDRAVYLLVRCRIYERLYLDDHPTSPAASKAQKCLYTSLRSVYTLILRFLSRAGKLYNKNTAGRALEAFWNPTEISDFEDICKDNEERLHKEAENCKAAYDKAELTAISLMYEQMLTNLRELRNLSDPIFRMDDRVQAIWVKFEAQEQMEILQWVSDIPVKDDHIEAAKGRTEGTGDWLLRRDEFSAWVSSDQSTILWVHGILGAGKTKLASKAIDHFESREPTWALAYFYCNRKDLGQESRRNPDDILRSFVKQLAAHNRSIHSSLLNLYRQKRATGFASKRLSFEESKAIILELTKTYSRTFLILDGLDESHKGKRADLLDAFNELVEQSEQLKILISSRRDDDIKFQLERNSNISIQAIDNQYDITIFVEERLSQIQRKRRNPISNSLCDKITDTLLAKSHGMFQWVSLQLDQISRLDREQDILERLGSLPKDLNETYEEIYRQILNSEGSQPEIALRAFQWILCSYKRLLPSVLVAAVCQNPETAATEPIDIDINYVLNACRNLLVIENDLCMFSHLSVREYFENNQSNESILSQANSTIARVSLSLLIDRANWEHGRAHIEIEDIYDFSGSFYDHPFSFGDSRTKDDPLAQLLYYSRVYWPDHVRDCENTKDVRIYILLEKFFESMAEGGPAYESWRTFPRMRTSERDRHFHEWLGGEGSATFSIVSPSQLVCSLGLSGYLEYELDKGTIRLEELQRQVRPLLVHAVLSGSLSTMRTLLDRGADVNQQDISAHSYGSALVAAAAKSGKKDAVDTILASGGDVNMRVSAGRFGNALVAASTTGDRDMVELLLKSGADVNMHSSIGEYGSALVAATSSGHRGIVKLLLEARADVNARVRGRYRTAMEAAKCHYLREKLTALLKEYGGVEHTQLPSSFDDGGLGSGGKNPE